MTWAPWESVSWGAGGGGGRHGQGAEGEQAWESSELNFGIDFLKIWVD